MKTVNKYIKLAKTCNQITKYGNRENKYRFNYDTNTYYKIYKKNK